MKVLLKSLPTIQKPVNASAVNVDVLDISNPSVPTLMFTIEVSMDGGAANCVAFHNGVLAVAIADKNEQMRKKTFTSKGMGSCRFYVWRHKYENFLNGKEVGSKSCKGKIDFNGANFYVGAESDGGQPDDDHGRFAGRIDEVYVANRAFSEKEIQELMISALLVELKTKLLVICS